MTFTFNGTTVTTNPNIVFTNRTGGFGPVKFNVPIIAVGSYPVTGIDWTGLSATTNFVVTTLNPLVLNPASGPSYTNVGLYGNGYNPNSPITVTYDGSPITVTPTITTNLMGSFSGEIINVPAGTIGQHNVQACDNLGICGNAIFTLTTANISNFASGSQTGNVTSITPIITSDTSMLALRQDLYYDNKTLIQDIVYPSPISISANIPTILNTFTKNISSKLTFYENVTTTDGFNQYITKSNLLTFQPIINYIPTNLSPGNQNFSATNTNQIPIQFIRQDINSSSTNLLVSYPNSYNLTCNLQFSVEQFNKTYIKIPNISIPNNRLQSTFTFKNLINDIVTTNCTDVNTHTSGIYVLTESLNNIPNFPGIQQIKQFRSGSLGTHGQLGAVDLISMAGILIAMIGLSRVNEAAGISIATIILSLEAFFQIIQWPTIVTGVIAVIVMIAVVSTKKLPWSQ